MAVTQQAWLASLQALLPPGRAFNREPDSVLTKVLGAMAAMLLAAQIKFEDLVDQADPRSATTLLTDWERMLGLPDKCTPAGQQLLGRRAAACQRLTEQGGSSRQYFIDMAANLGAPGVTITEFKRMTCNSHCNSALFSEADKFTWRTNFATPALKVRKMNCNSHCNSALQSYTPSPVECAFKERKPAHTNVIFAYAA